MAAVLAVIAALLASRALYVVGSGESAAVLRFGRLVDDAVAPGLHVRAPAGIDRIARVATSEVLRMPIEGDLAPALDLVTADENLIEASLTVQYRVGRLGAFLYAIEDPARLLHQAVRAALLEAVASTDVETLLTTGKAAVQNRVRQEAQRRLDRYGAGIGLVSVTLQALTPPGEAGGAFRAVSDARAEAAQAESRAEGERERTLGWARGEAAQLLESARAEANARITEADGAIARFEHLRSLGRAGREQVVTALRAESVGRILPRVRLIVLPPGAPPRIDLQMIERAGGAILPPASPASASPAPVPPGGNR